MRIILASASPRRKELMQQAGFDFEILVGNAEEKITKEKPEELVEELSWIKACKVAELVEDDVLIIGADTIVSKNQKILGKPKDAEEARAMLQMLQGTQHQVYTGVTFIKKKNHECQVHSFYERTDVFMSKMSEEEIAEYIATEEPFDKAGAYGIQGRAGIFIEKIEGDYYNVVGLPISRLYREWKKIN